MHIVDKKFMTTRITDDVGLSKENVTDCKISENVLREETRTHSIADIDNAVLKRCKWSVTNGKPEVIQWVERHSHGADHHSARCMTSGLGARM